MKRLSRISGLDAACGFVGLIWIVFIIDGLIPPLQLATLGIRPRTLTGLWGILFWPLLHVSFPHIVANTGALFFLMLLVFALNRRRGWTALFSVWLLGGALVWLLGRSATVHLGASGIVFGLVGFLVAGGMFRREWRAVAVALLVLVGYGGLIVSLLHRVAGVSWIGHAGGFASGVVTAWATRRQSFRG